MNSFPEDFNPKLLIKNSETFQKQAQKLRTEVLKQINNSILSGSCQVSIDSYGPAVVDLVKNELLSRGFTCEIVEKKKEMVCSKWLSVNVSLS